MIVATVNLASPRLLYYNGLRFGVMCKSTCRHLTIFRLQPSPIVDEPRYFSRMRLYLNERPRTFIVLDSRYSLILRHPAPTYNNHSRAKRHVAHKHHDGMSKEGRDPQKSLQISNKVIVEFVKTELLDLSSFKDITPSKSKHNKTLLGFIGLLHVKGNIHLGFITRSTRVASARLNETINVVTDVTFYCLNNDEFDKSINLNEEEPGNIEDTETHPKFPSLSVQKLLKLGHFYYSDDFDITSNLQERGLSTIDGNRVYADTPYFRSFMWNHYMISEIIDFRNGLSALEKQCFDDAKFSTILTRGYAKTINVNLENKDQALLTLISKQSCIKKGPLFGDWGCDDDGAVSNYVESEVIIFCKRFCFSYVIVRGNVPTFWELQNTFGKKSIISRSSKKLVLTRSFEATQHAFNKHFDLLGNQYGDIHVIDCLLRDQASYKGQLKDNFKQHLQSFWNSRERTDDEENYKDEKDVFATSTNYSVTATDMPVSTSFMKKVGYSASNPSELIGPLIDYILIFGALFYNFEDESYVGKQLGVFRVNSFDCLAKANFICKSISQEVIELAFRDLNIRVDEQLRLLHAKLWKENDEVLKELTQNYLSTSTDVPFEKSAKKGIKAQLAKKYLNVVGEIRPNEMAMRKLLGRLQSQENVKIYNPLHQYVTTEMRKRSKEYSYKKDINIFASTFNVNGDLCKDEQVSRWIYPLGLQNAKEYDIVFIGFEEIVELTPGKMMNARSENLMTWEAQVRRILEGQHSRRSKYVSLWSGQMGGVALLLFIKGEHVGQILNVESAVRKTGLGGMSANKGGMAVSLQYLRTKFCFVCSHLAAGLNNLEERHQNYKAISKGISFSKNRKIRDHDAVIWVGDLNFRISMPNETVRSLIEQRKFAELFENDQLNKQMAKGETFPFYDEMEITFPPTYKFDNYSLTYDTSDKQRIPAWTDRVLHLSRTKVLKQELYGSCKEITFSDHRPVYATFIASVVMVNELVKKQVSNEIYEGYKNVVGGVNYLLTGSDVLKFVADVTERNMPPPSSDSSKWWLQGGLPAKISIKEFSEGEDEDEVVINPQTTPNPFRSNAEEAIRLSTLLLLLV